MQGRTAADYWQTLFFMVYCPWTSGVKDMVIPLNRRKTGVPSER